MTTTNREGGPAKLSTARQICKNNIRQHYKGCVNNSSGYQQQEFIMLCRPSKSKYPIKPLFSEEPMFLLGQFIFAIFNTRDRFLSSNFAGITPAI